MHVLLSAFEFVLTAVMAVGVVYVNYVLSIRTNADYNAEEELKKQNMGVAILLAAMLFASGLIVKSGIYPAVSMVRLAVASHEAYLPIWQVALIGLAHIPLVFCVAIFTISLSLRFYGRLTTGIDEGAELKKGNPAVGVVLAAVVIVVGMYVSDGVSALTKSLIPQPSLGSVSTVKVMH